MDQSNFKNYLCKVSIVAEDGTILFDSLVNPEVTITYSLFAIHGIRASWLKTAPTLKAIQSHIALHYGQCIFVGHGVKHDLQAMCLSQVRFIDTSYFEDKGAPADLEFKRKNPKKLKDLASLYLKAVI